MMPVMNGWEFRHAIDDDPDLQGRPGRHRLGRDGRAHSQHRRGRLPAQTARHGPATSTSSVAFAGLRRDQLTSEPDQSRRGLRIANDEEHSPAGSSPVLHARSPRSPTGRPSGCSLCHAARVLAASGLQRPRPASDSSARARIRAISPFSPTSASTISTTVANAKQDVEDPASARGDGERFGLDALAPQRLHAAGHLSGAASVLDREACRDVFRGALNLYAISVDLALRD